MTIESRTETQAYHTLVLHYQDIQNLFAAQGVTVPYGLGDPIEVKLDAFDPFDDREAFMPMNCDDKLRITVTLRRGEGKG